jgi:CheY-like chemotaxis protein
VAVQLLQATRYDIVLLDISMPGMNGFELCETLRRMPQYKETPVIFITGNGDFQNRAQGILSGGNDLITKPTSPLELVLKTTMHLLQPQGRRLEPVAKATVPRLNAPPVVLRSATTMQNDQARNEPPQIAATRPAPPQIMAGGNGAEGPLPASAEAIKSSAPENLAELPKPESHVGLPQTDGADKPVPSEINNGSATPELKRESAPTALRNEAPPPSRLVPLAQSTAMQRDGPLNDKNLKLNMENKNKSAFDEAAQGVARIIFGDENLTDMNVRLTRIALERYNVPQMQSPDEVAQGVARIIFGDGNVTDMNVRLTRIALERYNVPKLLSQPAEANYAPLGVPRLSSVSL